MPLHSEAPHSEFNLLSNQMNMKKFFILFPALCALVMSGCNDFLDRPTKTALTDDTYWKNPENIRLYVNGGYTNYFTGYNSGWSATKATGVYGSPEYSDDATNAGAQADILNAVPADNWYRSEGIRFLARRGGTGWDFSWIRKWNILINRLEKNKDSYTTEAYNHWMGVARFFRAFEYSQLVISFGDVPYYDHEIASNDYNDQFKARDPRSIVMDKCMEDFDFAVSNIREDDGVDYLNRYVAATLASRCMLFEGTWYIYHKNDEAMKTNTDIDAYAKKFLQAAVTYTQMVINSGKYAFDTEFNALFGSTARTGKEIMLYRSYSDALSVRHCTGSYCNLREGQTRSGNLSSLKAWICNDGKPYTSSKANLHESFDMKDLVVSRDPRFEATFNGATVHLGNSTGIYITKFINREGPTLWEDASNTNRPEYRSSTNNNGFPCVRYAETVLNWIEAKAELADKFGGAAVTQEDIDKSINAIRHRPIAPEAVAKGVKQTADLQISNIPDDPARTSQIEANTLAGIVKSPLIWEIRRERRMEFYMEHFRTRDIRRWGKLELMQGSTNPDILLGAFLKLDEAKTQPQRPFVFSASDKGLLKVQLENGQILAYDCTLDGDNNIVSDNSAQMHGYLIPRNVKDRGSIGGVKQYLEPICTDVINDFKNNGYESNITQNPGW